MSERFIDIKITLQDKKCAQCGAPVVLISAGGKTKIEKCTNRTCNKQTNETLKR